MIRFILTSCLHDKMHVSITSHKFLKCMSLQITLRNETHTVLT